MFGEQLKHYRRLRKYTQKELAMRLNVSQQTIAAWEYGRTSPSPDMIAAIATILEVSTDRLLCQETEEVQEAVKIIEALRDHK